MKKAFLFLSLFILNLSFAQEHFSGINISRRVGILNASFNPAELTNLSNTYEVSVFNTSLNVSNNKVSFGDIVNSDKDIEDLIFDGNEAANMRLDLLISGPAFAMKYNKWAFGISTSAVAKANIIDVDVNLGNALTNSGINSIFGATSVNSNYNQKINAATWGEIGLSLARDIYDTDKYKVSVGTNVRLLFPSSYTNFAADKFNGTIVNTAGDLSLTDTQANLNIAYSGPIADGFTDADNFNDFFSSGINGYAVDLGVNFRIKVADNPKDYKFNSGLSIKNIGSMTFKSDNNESSNYNLNISNTQFLDLNQFEDVDNVKDIEQILLSSGYLTKTSDQKDFTIKLPTLFTAYADLKLTNRLYVSAFTQQKIVDDSDNDFSTTQNSITLTPRFSGENYEIFIPLSDNEISGFTGGFGFRLGGFFMGSGSILTAMIDDTKQADVYLGFRIGF
ncbi:hypothetical protein [uncultured Flavobacterium sp.]|uniref:hypothetical protein n=1 Tax=uncultured Flavobacterium sp. TaxID=165435 RepID=UPI0030EE6C80|tara:strand:+ start:309114 stop:310460 length:1347 start_codon:yes stop_codon:yes gene_type:complete